MNLKQQILNINTKTDFLSLAFKVFDYQYQNNLVYKQWCDMTLKDKPKTIDQIPFLPINFFRTHKVISSYKKEMDYFLSSGTTTDQRSKHFVFDKNYYLQNCQNCFEQFFPKVEQFCYVFLLPNYILQKHSSLICMCESFKEKSSFCQSDFFLNDFKAVNNLLKDNEKNNIPTILFGVSYALLDLIEYEKLHLNQTLVFETGGMKGRRKELPKSVLHNILSEGFGVETIYSEYGMCELFSQAYSLGKGIFTTSKQMKIIIKQNTDPFVSCDINKSGRINIIDLANIDTCSFIQTQDIGRLISENQFIIEGRADNSMLRGCNLMYDSLQ